MYESDAVASIFRFYIFAFRSTMQRVSAKNGQWTPLVSKMLTKEDRFSQTTFPHSLVCGWECTFSEGDNWYQSIGARHK